MEIPRKRTLLLVEDEVIVAMIERSRLEEAGYAVIHVVHGEDAIDAMERAGGPVDLVLMDIDLGAGIDGTETAREILKIHDVPIVFLSSHTDPLVVRRTEEISSYGYVVKNSGFTVLDASVRMAFKLHEAKKKEQGKEALFQTAYAKLLATLHALPDLFLELDREGFIYDYRLPDPEEKSYPAGGIRGKNIRDLLPEHAVTVLNRAIEEAEASGRHSGATFLQDMPSGQVWYELSVAAKPDPEGNEHCFIVLMRNITERELTRARLKESEETFSRAFRNAPAVFAISTYEDERFIDVNDRFLETTGFNYDELIGRKPGELGLFPYQEDRQAVYRAIRATGRARDIGIRLRKKDGELLDGLFSAEKIRIGGFDRWITMMEDITERKRAQENVASLLREKEILLREVHHRIKNNMNTVISLLAMQADPEHYRDPKDVLQDAANRVRSMSVLYDKLYVSENSTTVSAGDYLSALIEEIAGVFPQRPSVSIQTDMDEILLDASRLHQVGIIVNELITNSMKYAFSGRGGGILSVAMKKNGEWIQLICEDTGPGMPEGVSLQNPTGFGLQLVRILSEQLGGTARFERTSGLRFSLEFPASP